MCFHLDEKFKTDKFTEAEENGSYQKWGCEGAQKVLVKGTKTELSKVDKSYRESTI